MRERNPPLDETDVFAWASGKTWWIGPLILIVVLLIIK